MKKQIIQTSKLALQGTKAFTSGDVLWIYMYNRDKSILYFYSRNCKDFIDSLKIQRATFEKHLEKGTYYLGKYLFTRDERPAVGTKFKEISLSEVFLMLEKDRGRFRRKKDKLIASPLGEQPKNECLPEEAGKLKHWFVTGICDGEACFYISVTRDSRQKTGWLAVAGFSIGLHVKDRALLELIQGFFGVGKINKQGKDTIQLQVASIKDLKVIIDHFNKYPLITQKRADFELFKQVVDLMDRKQHLTPDGLQQIVNIRASINNGLSDVLKAAFPNTEPVPRPKVVELRPLRPQVIKDPNWVAGFTSGEGSFAVGIEKSTTQKSGVQVRLRFIITQHSRDAELLQSLVTYFGCGNFRTRGVNTEAGDFIVVKISDITDKIIPFFVKYRIVGVKALDFADFCKAADIVKAKAHLTSEGLEEVRQIKSGMNRGRSWSS